MRQFADSVMPFIDEVPLEDAELLLSVAKAFRDGRRSASSSPTGDSKHLLNHLHSYQTLQPSIAIRGSVLQCTSSNQNVPATVQISSDYSLTKTSHPRRSAKRTKLGVRKLRNRRSRTNKSELERLQELEQEPLLGNIRPNEVFCLICEDWVALDRRNRYYAGLWYKHKAYRHAPVSDF